MEINLDIYRLIIWMSPMIKIKYLALVDKNFYQICLDKNLQIKIFQDKNLPIIDNNINTVGGYYKEYKKVSYATHLTVYLLEIDKRDIAFNSIFFKIKKYDEISQIFPSEKFEPTIQKISLSVNLEKFEIYKMIDNESSYLLFNYSKSVVFDLFLKIFYYYPTIFVSDTNYNSVIIFNVDFYKIENFDRTKIENRYNYWTKSLESYHSKYF